MASLILMYVFYDVNGDIKAITPALDENFSAHFSVATFPLPLVEKFLTGVSNTFDYKVKKVEKSSGITYVLLKKLVTINYTRSLDSYLTKVETTDTKEQYFSGIIITNNTENKVFSVRLSTDIKDMYKNGTEEEQERVSDFLNKGPSTVYITKRNNPYHLLFSFVLAPRALFDTERLYFNYTGSYTNVSAYTKKLVGGYEYKEKAE